MSSSAPQSPSPLATTPPEAAFRKLGFPSREAFEFPNIVNAEVYRSQCPCRCRHCPVGRTEPGRRAARFGQRGMDLGLFRKIVLEMARYPRRVLRVHAAGEPLLWDGLTEALASTRRCGVRTWLFTSAVTEDRELLAAVCASADVIEVSLNGTTREDYLATKGVDAFDLVVANLRHMRQRMRPETPARLIVSRVESLDAGADGRFVQLWKASGLVDDAFVRSYHTYNALLPELACARQPAPAHEPCLVHWARFNVSVEGKVVVCFNELFKEKLDQSLVIGDVRVQSIAEIWHGAALTALRRAELSGDYSALPIAGALPCPHCGSCQPLRGHRQTSEFQMRQLDRP
ncbi:MAG TPA: SPASM domain-containing protein [Thermoguttaceae bacterium]|nr:SPASM domain-containing protein [Thermoguttaceae bacterium]